MKAFFFAAALGLITLFVPQGGDPNITAKYAVGEVKSIDATAKQLTIKTDAGSTVTVSLSDKTTYKKLAPGETSLTNATDVTFTDLAEGLYFRKTARQVGLRVPAGLCPVSGSTVIFREIQQLRSGFRINHRLDNCAKVRDHWSRLSHGQLRASGQIIFVAFWWRGP